MNKLHEQVAPSTLSSVSEGLMSVLQCTPITSGIIMVGGEGIACDQLNVLGLVYSSLTGEYYILVLAKIGLVLRFSPNQA